jgi:regulator of protease activity HflC (stomatin/prohibitin superfamily)
MSDPSTALAVVGVVVVLTAMLMLVKCATTIRPYEVGIVTIFGSYRGLLNPGLAFVHPLAQVQRVDLRVQALEIPSIEAASRDGHPIRVAATVSFKVVEAPKAIFEVQDYRASIAMASHAALRSVFGQAQMADIPSQLSRLNALVREQLAAAAQGWGISIEAVEIRWTGSTLNSP